MYSTITNPGSIEGSSGELDRLYGFLLDTGRGPFHRLGPLNMIQSLGEGELIRLLNDRKRPKASDCGLLPLMSRVPPVPEILREWIDEWLDSGRDSDGVEKPEERHFTEGDRISLAAHEYSKRNRISLLGISRALEVWFSPYEDRDGRRPLLGVGNEDVAREKLVFFLLSEFRFKLAKCRKEECGKYFALKHWKRTYKRGTVCTDCQRIRSQESALRATSADRVKAGWLLCHLVARKFRKQIQKGPDWHRQAPLRAAVLEYLNSRIESDDLLRAVYLSGPRRGVTGKWLSRASNWNAIEAVVKGEI